MTSAVRMRPPVLAAATSPIVDRACEEIADYAAKLGLKAGDRFSPGYADLPLDVQADFLEVLQAPKRLGLTASVSNLLVPTKSVTCIVGLYPKAPAKGHHLGCGACNIWSTCQLRQRGTPCWEREPADGREGQPAQTLVSTTSDLPFE